MINIAKNYTSQAFKQNIPLYKEKNIVFIAELDWKGLHNQSQVMALGFANIGYNVFYINRMLQRWPRIEHIIRYLKPTKEKGFVNTYPHPPKNLNTINLRLGPPVNWLRIVNRFIIKRTLKKYKIKNPIIIVYSPTFNAIDIINLLKPDVVSYICYHNFNANVSLPDVLLSEKELIKISDVLFADSLYLQNRIKEISGGKKVFRSPPGVYYKSFHRAYRGDEVNRCKNIYYYGGIGPHLDLSLYESLAKKFNVVFIGVVDPVIRKKIPANIEIRPPVANLELPKILKDADILAILYKDSSYIRGVIPAKFFECLATGKPLLVSGLNEAKPYLDVVYDVQGSARKGLEVIEKLPEMETPERFSKRDKISIEADWSNRFKMFIKHLKHTVTYS